MNPLVQTRNEEVAVRRRATSAKPPRVSSPFLPWSSSQRAPQPFPSTVLLDTPGAPQEGLRCFPAAYPLPVTIGGHGKAPVRFLGHPGDPQ
jgi:hypothetical protein